MEKKTYIFTPVEYIPGNAAPKKREPEKKNKKTLEKEKANRVMLKLRMRKALKEQRKKMMSVAVPVLICALLLCGNIKIHSEVDVARKKLDVAVEELAVLRESNNDFEKRLISSENLVTIKKKAKKMGMKYPTKKQIKKYHVDKYDYMVVY